jgi:AcrR family transcriptional regulator
MGMAGAGRAEVAAAVGTSDIQGPIRIEAGVSAQETRIAAAALLCMARWGTIKTTLDDVARQAGCSRATVYRLFPGGKDAVVESVARREVDRFFAALAERLEAAETLEDALAVGMSEAASLIRDHPALQFLLAYEPETILPRLAFSRCDEVLRSASQAVAPHLARWLPADDAERAAELAARLVLSYSSAPTSEVDMTDEASVRRMLQTCVLPGLRLLDHSDASSDR